MSKPKDRSLAWRSTVAGKYHFDGPIPLRPLNDYKANPLTIQKVMDRFGKTLAAKMNGHSNICIWMTPACTTAMWQFEVTIVRKEPKIPERCSIPIPHRVVITYIPT